jgi:hypothetical protein
MTITRVCCPSNGSATLATAFTIARLSGLRPEDNRRHHATLSLPLFRGFGSIGKARSNQTFLFVPGPESFLKDAEMSIKESANHGTTSGTAVQAGQRQLIALPTKASAKADLRHVAPEARTRIAFQVRHMSVEAARKEWGVTPAAALEAFAKARLAELERRLQLLEDAALYEPRPIVMQPRKAA